MAELVVEIAALRRLLGGRRQARKTMGLVPTLGALHAGHARLLEIARAETDVVVASIFLNPTQFNRQDDLDQYPRTLDQDIDLCRAAVVDIVFAPTAAEMYPQEQLTWIDAPALTQYLCGPGRPGHFRGVATGVMKLFQIVQPDRAYFGEKDAQQLAVIRRLVADFNVPLDIIRVPTVREAHGLPPNSRNRPLRRQQRPSARPLYR